MSWQIPSPPHLMLKLVYNRSVLRVPLQPHDSTILESIAGVEHLALKGLLSVVSYVMAPAAGCSE